MARALVSEADLQATVIDLAHCYGWMVWHQYDSRTNPVGRNKRRMLDPGFPDLVLVHPEQKQVLFVELKTAEGVVSKAQWDWYNALALAGMRVFIWRPVDLDSGEIESVLVSRPAGLGGAGEKGI